VGWFSFALIWSPIREACPPYHPSYVFSPSLDTLGRRACPTDKPLGRRALSGLIRMLGLKDGGFAASCNSCLVSRVSCLESCVLVLVSLAPIRLPIREDICDLIRLPEPVSVCFPALALSAAGFLLSRLLLNDSRVAEAIGSCGVVGRLSVISGS